MVPLSRVLGAAQLEPPVEPRIEVDEYIPIRFRSYIGLLGAKYLRIGNFDTTLLEFLLEPESLAVRGITLTCFEAVHQPRRLKPLSFQEGVPAVDLSRMPPFKGPRDAQRIELIKSFSVGLGDDFIEIDLSNISDSTSAFTCGQIEFYASLDVLTGMRIVQLELNEMEVLKLHFPGH